MKRLLFSLLLLTACNLLWSQAALDSKGLPQEKVRYNSQLTQFKIDAGRVFLNGRLIPSQNLPSSLQKVDPDIYYETTVAGVTEFTFNLGERDYLVANGNVTELSGEGQSDQLTAGNKTATEAYYSQLKRESPGLFYGLGREGILLEEVRSLLMDYSVAQGTQREKVKEDIRLVLGQLYDINQRNKEMEIEELEDMIQAAKEEVQYRKAHKSEIIDNSLKNLLRE